MKKGIGLYIFGMVFALAFTFGAVVNAEMFGSPVRGVDRDLALYENDYVNNTIFGNDKAYNSARGADPDADFRTYNFVPESYGLMGDYDNWTER